MTRSTTATTTTAAPFAAAAASPTVSTQWVCDHLGSDTMIVLDASVVRQGAEWVSGIDDHLRSRIPAAVFADLLVDFSDPSAVNPFTRPSAERFEQATRRLGISTETLVVVYDNAYGQWAARLWWLFRSFGFDRVSVLDGGFTKWNLEDRPVETPGSRRSVAQVAVTLTSPQLFRAEERPEFWADKPLVQAVVDGRVDALLLSAVPHEFFAPGSGVSDAKPEPGAAEDALFGPSQPGAARLDARMLDSLRSEYGPAADAGHIPGSINVPSMSLINPETHALLRRDELRNAFGPVLAAAAPASATSAAHEVGGPRHIVAYCGDGVSAATDALALATLGHTSVSIYDGSLSEWGADPSCRLDGGLAA